MKIITTCIIIVVLNYIYVTVNSKYLILRKPEELNTYNNCSEGFNSTLECYATGFDCAPDLHCKVTCTSKDWTYFYLYTTTWNNNYPFKFYVSPMTPTKTSKVMDDMECPNGDNKTLTECISWSDYTTFISLSCKINCTFSEYSYMLQYDFIFNFEYGKYYHDTYIVSNYKSWKPTWEIPATLCEQLKEHE